MRSLQPTGYLLRADQPNLKLPRPHARRRHRGEFAYFTTKCFVTTRARAQGPFFNQQAPARLQRSQPPLAGSFRPPPYDGWWSGPRQASYSTCDDAAVNRLSGKSAASRSASVKLPTWSGPAWAGTKLPTMRSSHQQNRSTEACLPKGASACLQRTLSASSDPNQTSAPSPATSKTLYEILVIHKAHSISPQRDNVLAVNRLRPRRRPDIFY